MDSLRFESVRLLLSKLDRKVLNALVREAFEIAVTKRAATDGVTVDLFLIAFYAKYRRKASRYFVDETPLKQALESIQADPRRRDIPSGPVALTGPIEAIGADLDQNLSSLLWDAVKIASGAGRKKADFGDIMSALCLRDEMVDILWKERGLRPKGFLSPLTMKNSEKR